MNILSIQSHVAYGHVGNTAATFPLQRMGFEVWPVHTVMFSNHAGYDGFKGHVLNAVDVRDVILGIEDRGVFINCDAVLSGYLGDSSLGEVVLEAVSKIRKANSDVLYCCDPVMGDVGRNIYVHETIPAFLRDKAIGSADIITPNLFELSLLAQRPLKGLDDVIIAARDQLRLGPKLALVTSVTRTSADSVIKMLVADNKQAYLLSTPKIEFEITPNGAGDVTAALFLAFTLKGLAMNDALENVARAVYAMFECSKKKSSRELQIIAAQDSLLSNDRPFKAKPL